MTKTLYQVKHFVTVLKQQAALSQLSHIDSVLSVTIIYRPSVFRIRYLRVLLLFHSANIAVNYSKLQ